MADRIVTTGITPNWSKWRLIPEPRLWECVALSLNIDPDRVHERRFHETSEFEDRLVVARANCGLEKALQLSRIDLLGGVEKVSLRQFAAWVKQIGWPAPSELLAMADAADANGERRAHNKRETEARNREWQEEIDKLAAEHPGRPHSDLCHMLAKKNGAEWQTIRRNTKLGHS